MSRQLVLVALGFLAAITAAQVFLLLEQNVPMFHDSFLILQMQFVFFNEESLHQQIPLWMPFISGGVRGGANLIQTAGILSLVLSSFATLLKGVNFLMLYEAGVIFDEFVLILGCVLLAKRYFKEMATVIFVTAAVVFTVSPTTQTYWNFHVFYMIPIILYCLDRALREASPKYVFLTTVFVFANLMGNILYLAPLWLFASLIFALTLILTARRAITSVLMKFISSFNWRHLLLMVFPAIVGSSILVIALGAINEITVRKLGRALGGGIAGLGSAIGFGPDPSFVKYYGLMDVYGNFVYLTVYVGLLVLPFMVVAILKVKSRISYAFGVTGLLLVLFSAGTFVTVLFYYLIPFATTYRYVSLATKLATFFIIFYAGYGFEEYFRLVRSWSGKSRFEKPERIVLLTPIVVLGAMLLVICVVEFNVPPLSTYISPPSISDPTNILNPSFLLPQPLQVLLLMSVTVWMFVSILLFPKQAKLILILLLAVHVVDVFTFHSEAEQDRGSMVDQSFVNLFNTYNYNFSMVRNRDYVANATTYLDPQGNIHIMPGNIVYNSRFQTVTSYDRAQYSWQSDTFWFQDTGVPSIYTDSYPTPLDNLNWAFVSAGKAGYSAGVFQPPHSIAYQKIVGIGLPKLAVFKYVHVLPTSADEASIITSSNFTGDMLLASETDASWRDINLPVVQKTSSLTALATNDRIGANFTIEHFSFDRLSLRVVTNTNTPGLLFYADTWDSKWSAYVNGSPVPVIKADMAYKAIPIPSGQSRVTFVFGSSADTLLVDAVVLTATMAFIGIIFLAITDLRRRDEHVVTMGGWEVGGKSNQILLRFRGFEDSLKTFEGSEAQFRALARRIPLVFSSIYPVSAFIALYFGTDIFSGPIQLKGDTLALLPALLGALLIFLSVVVAIQVHNMDERELAGGILTAGIVLDVVVLAVIMLAVYPATEFLFNAKLPPWGSILIPSHLLLLLVLRVFVRSNRMQVVYWIVIALTVIVWFGIPLCVVNSCPPPNGSDILPPVPPNY